jgi:hypothetical protein
MVGRLFVCLFVCLFGWMLGAGKLDAFDGEMN